MEPRDDYESAQLDHELHAQFEYEAMLEAEAEGRSSEYVPGDDCVGMVNGCECNNCQF